MMELKNHTIGPWTVPTIELPGATRTLPPTAIFGTIVNAIVDGPRGRERQQKWKVRVASEVKAKRGAQWHPSDSFTITLALSFHLGNHGNRPLDVENFVKPILDALAAGLLCDPRTDPKNISHWDYDDSNFNTLLIHRLGDANAPGREGIAVAVSAQPRGGIRTS